MTDPELLSSVLPRALEQLMAEWQTAPSEPQEETSEPGGEHEA